MINKIFKFSGVLLVGASLLAGTAFAQEPLEIEGGTVLFQGLNGPQGVLLDADGNVWVAESGLGGEEEIQWANAETGQLETVPMGNTARVVMISPEGELTEVAVLPSILAGTDTIGVSRLALLDGELYATNGQWLEANGADRLDLMGAVIHVDAEGAVTEAASTWAVEDASNPDGLIKDSHPYGITVGPDGWLWVADAGANSLVRFNPETGEGEAVAAFAGVPAPFPNPTRGDAMETDPVPTAVAFDEDGNAYVSLLPGFPFLPGSAKVVLVTPEGEVSDYATGLTMLTDLRVGPDGELYGVQFGVFGEQGPVPNSGAIVRIQEGAASELVVGGLPFATSIDFNADGDAYVTVNGVGAPGSGAVVVFPGLTDMEGQPLPAMEG